MSGGYDIIITSPADNSKPIDPGRHFNVWGKILHTSPVPVDAVLRVELYSPDGALLRHNSQSRKNNKNIFVYHPALTAYPEQMDPGRKKLIEFGFPELMVKDMADPYGSLRDATIKCWYSDDVFKSFIVSGTDTAHGMLLDDGINYTDENGDPYTALGCGVYTVRVTLYSAEGGVLAQKEFDITIGARSEQALCRFNPVSHRARMTEWCAEIGCDISDDTLTGYLEPYLGKWLYHMGLLKMYIANDIPFYNVDNVHMFVYLMQPDSTSYSCELPFLQVKRRVGDENHFFAYHYDIGEAVLEKDGQKGKILRFKSGEYLYIYRVDSVSEAARENVYSLGGEEVTAHHTDKSDIVLDADERFAVTGVIRPRQKDPALFELLDDNTFAFSGKPEELEYVFTCGGSAGREKRLPLMTRVAHGEDIGSSALEFYNVFTPSPEWRGKKVKLKISVSPEAETELELRFK